MRGVPGPGGVPGPRGVPSPGGVWSQGCLVLGDGVVPGGDPRRLLLWAVRILLECILVYKD